MRDYLLILAGAGAAFAFQLVQLAVSRRLRRSDLRHARDVSESDELAQVVRIAGGHSTELAQLHARTRRIGEELLTLGAIVQELRERRDDRLAKALEKIAATIGGQPPPRR